MDAELLECPTADKMAIEANCRLLLYMDKATNPVPDEESAVIDFMVQLLNRVGYDHKDRIARTRKKIPFFLCGEWSYVKADVCLVSGNMNDVLLLVQEEKRHLGPVDVRPQLVAGAVAAFQDNNRWRETVLGIQPLYSKTIAGIVMVGSSPTFFKIPITTGLVQSIEQGMCPADHTDVLMHVPEIPRPEH